MKTSVAICTHGYTHAQMHACPAGVCVDHEALHMKLFLSGIPGSRELDGDNEAPNAMEPGGL